MVAEGEVVELPDEVVTEVRTRLRRAAGQVQGVERMLAEGRECKDVLSQIQAARKALDQSALKLLAAGFAYCLERPEEAAAGGYAREAMEKLFMKMG